MLCYSSDIFFGVLIIFLLFLSFASKHPEPHRKHIKSLMVKHNRTYLEKYLKFNERYEFYKRTFFKTGQLAKNNEFPMDYLSYENSTFLKKCVGIASRELGDKNATMKKILTLHQKFDIKPCSVPLRVDWRKAGIITEIRNQGKCGSCYAHSVIASIESRLALVMNLSTPIAFSVQQMLDCSREFNSGCSGGDTCELLEWLKTNRIKILPNNLYPASLSGNECRTPDILRNLRTKLKTVRIKQYACFNFTGNEHELLAVIAQRGPITASVDASLWKNYLGGIIKYNCNGPSNHAIQIVGYDLTVENPYYIVRNSWGSSFGNDGYAKVAIGDNTCGIASEVALFNIAWK